MANNYVYFSESLVVDTDEQKAWLENWLKRYDENMNPAELQKWCEECGLDSNGDDADWWPNFNWSFSGARTDAEQKKARADENYKPVQTAPWDMWIREDESGAPDHVAAEGEHLHYSYVQEKLCGKRGSFVDASELTRIIG